MPQLDDKPDPNVVTEARSFEVQPGSTERATVPLRVALLYDMDACHGPTGVTRQVFGFRRLGLLGLPDAAARLRPAPVHCHELPGHALTAPDAASRSVARRGAVPRPQGHDPSHRRGRSQPGGRDLGATEYGVPEPADVSVLGIFEQSQA